jgi:hypothetical protein
MVEASLQLDCEPLPGHAEETSPGGAAVLIRFSIHVRY